jgi:hypothetical protein
MELFPGIRLENAKQRIETRSLPHAVRLGTDELGFGWVEKQRVA